MNYKGLATFYEFLLAQDFTTEASDKLVKDFLDLDITSIELLREASCSSLLEQVCTSPGKLLALKLFLEANPKPKVKRNPGSTVPITNSHETDPEKIAELFAKHERHWNETFKNLTSFVKFEVKFFPNQMEFYCPLRNDFFQLMSDCRISNAKRTYEGLLKKDSAIFKSASDVLKRLSKMYQHTHKKKKGEADRLAKTTTIDKTTIDDLLDFEKDQKLKKKRKNSSSSQCNGDNDQEENDDCEDDQEENDDPPTKKSSSDKRKNRLNIQQSIIKSSSESSKKSSSESSQVVNIRTFLDRKYEELTTFEKVKYELLMNIFKKHPRYSEKTQQLFIYAKDSQNSMKALKQIGVPLPQKRTLQSNKIEYLLSYSDDLVDYAIKYFKGSILGCIGIDATSINQDPLYSKKHQEIFGFENTICCETHEDWLNFFQEIANGTHKYASNITTIHLQMIDTPNNRNNFILKAIPKSKYDSTDIENWITPIVKNLNQSNIKVRFFSSDFAAEHELFQSNQFKQLKPMKKGKEFNLLSCLSFNLNKLSDILIPIPDIRHLHRNLINQLIAPKRLIVVGTYVCCLQDILQLQQDYTISFPSGFTNFNDKQNQPRADFLISNYFINQIQEIEEMSGIQAILNSIQNIIESITSIELSVYSRLKKLAFGGFFILLQYHFAEFSDEYGPDYTFSKKSITAISYLIFGLSIGIIDHNNNHPNSLFLPFQLQEYKIENFYSFARSTTGSNRNLNCKSFLNSINTYTGLLVSGHDFLSTDLNGQSIAKYLYLPSNRHIQFILQESFESAKNLFQKLSDDSYNPPTIYRLLFDAKIPGIDYLLNESDDKLIFSDMELNEFKLQEKRWESKEDITTERQKFTGNENDFIQINGETFKKKQLVKQLTFSSQFTCDVSRSRRFNKTKQKSISSISQQMALNLLRRLQINPTTEKQIDESLTIGDFFIQQNYSETLVCQIRQIKKIKDCKERKHQKQVDNQSKDVNFIIKWEYCTTVSRFDDLSLFAFVLRSFEIRNNRLNEISKDFKLYYEELKEFPSKVTVENLTLIN